MYHLPNQLVDYNLEHHGVKLPRCCSVAMGERHREEGQRKKQDGQHADTCHHRGSSRPCASVLCSGNFTVQFPEKHLPNVQR